MDKNTALKELCLRIGDNGLILGHRLSEICGHGPILETDIALTNVALDLIGQARAWYGYAANIEGNGKLEDDYAYKRDVLQFRNVLLTEQPNGHFGDVITRQFLFDVFNYHYHLHLKNSSDEMVAGIAEKSLKEISYHMRFSGEWMVRLGDGTEESHQRVQESLHRLWMFTGDMLTSDETDQFLAAEGIAPDPADLKTDWHNSIKEILDEAGLQMPESGWMNTGGKKGIHTEYLGYILSDLQFLPRAYPDARW